MQIIEKSSKRVVARESLRTYILYSHLGALGVIAGVAWFAYSVTRGKSLEEALPISVLFLALGLVQSWRNPRIKIVAERSPPVITLFKEWTLVTRRQEISAKGLKKVLINEECGGSVVGNNSYYELKLVFENDRQEKLFRMWDNRFTTLFGLLAETERDRLKELGTAIARLYGVPCDGVFFPNILEFASGKKTITEPVYRP